MKKIFYFFVTITIFFVICATKFGNCQPTDAQQTLPISTQKIIDEISPFIDNDTAIVCYINLLAVKESYKLANIADGLSKVESFHERIRQNFTTISQRNDRKNSEKLWQELSSIIECGVTHTYIILNIRDLKFGAYFVLPDVQKNSDKAKCIEKYFEINNETKNDDKSQIKFVHQDDGKPQTLAVYKENYMIVVGAKSVSFFSMIYFVDRQLVLMLLEPQRMNAICGYYNLSLPERKEYINKRFENFKPSSNEKFQHGIKEVNDCNFIKAVFLFPDSVVAWEFMHLKKMDAPLNQITFDFLK
ncbi:MAG: hypothetical protein LBC74_09860, partial [Planctomycetaceae bacterium]|nr:hypothetical protein [Planctomycetaceae bacterium]